MKNKLILACAGSGKTTYLIEQALKIKDKSILITTYTNSNEQEIKNKFIDRIGYIPKNITIQTWFSFLLQHWVRPYQSVIYDCDIKGIDILGKKSTKLVTENNAKEYYFNSKNEIYRDNLPKFAFKVNEKTEGKLIARLEKIYQYIFIDEIQDLAGYDLDLIKEIVNSSIWLIMVGDRRQTIYITHYEKRNEKYRGKIDEYVIDKLTNKVCMDAKSLSNSYRCNQKICDFANDVFKDLQPMKSSNKQKTEHDGVFLVRPCDIEDYLIKFNPVQLRYSKSIKVNINYKAYNFGESKGLTFDRVLIYLTKNQTNWLKNHTIKLNEPEKLYVAITRAKYSVAIVFDELDKYQPKHTEVYPYKRDLFTLD